MVSKINLNNDLKDYVIQQFGNTNPDHKSTTEILSCFEEKFLHDTAINLSLENTYHIVFIHHFAISNKDKTIDEMTNKLRIEPETYREILNAIYYNYEETNSLKLNKKNKVRQIYRQLWTHDFYEWFEIKGHSLFCRRSNRDRRMSSLKADRRQNIKVRLITDFKMACVKGKLDRLQDVYDLRSYSFIEELKKTLVQAIYKYEFKDKLTQTLSNPNHIIGQAILTVREEVKYQGHSYSKSTEYKYLNAIIEGLDPIINCLSLSIIRSPQLEKEVADINESLEDSLMMLKKYRRLHAVSDHGLGTYIILMTLLENIRDYILEKYDVIVDRRKQLNRRSKMQIMPLIQMIQSR